MMTTIREFLPWVELPFKLRLALHFSRLGFEMISGASTVNPLLLSNALRLQRLVLTVCTKKGRKEERKDLVNRN